MGLVVKDLGMGGRKPAGAGDVFKGYGSGGDYLWIRDVGNDIQMGRVLVFLKHRVAMRITGRNNQ